MPPPYCLCAAAVAAVAAAPGTGGSGVHAGPRGGGGRSGRRGRGAAAPSELLRPPAVGAVWAGGPRLPLRRVGPRRR